MESATDNKLQSMCVFCLRTIYFNLAAYDIRLPNICTHTVFWLCLFLFHAGGITIHRHALVCGHTHGIQAVHIIGFYIHSFCLCRYNKNLFAWKLAPSSEHCMLAVFIVVEKSKVSACVCARMVQCTMHARTWEFAIFWRRMFIKI